MIVEERRLNDRELLVAKHAADLAVKQMTDNFYKEVGRTFINRFFIIVGAAFVAFAVGRGWISATIFSSK
jgi:hypothetical protein